MSIQYQDSQAKEPLGWQPRRMRAKMAPRASVESLLLDSDAPSGLDFAGPFSFHRARGEGRCPGAKRHTDRALLHCKFKLGGILGVRSTRPKTARDRTNQTNLHS